MSPEDKSGHDPRTPVAAGFAAFNEIENRFRRVLGLDKRAEFAQMARQHVDKKRLPPVQRDELLSFAPLRNAISHGRFYYG